MDIKEVFPVEVVCNDEVAVDGRILMKWLGKDESNFNRDIKSAIKRCMLEKNIDYQPLFNSEERSVGEGGENRIDYIFKASAAKKIAMSVRGERANEVRDYFLQCEAVAKYIEIEQPKSPEAISISDWKSQADDISHIASLCGYSDVAKKKMVIEIGYNIEARDAVSIVPVAMERDFLLGDDSIEHEGVAKIEFGGKVMNVTQIGEYFGKTAVEVNNALCNIGFQSKFYVNNVLYYKPTPRAEKYCTVITSHNKKSNIDIEKINGWKIKLIYDKLEILFKK